MKSFTRGRKRRDERGAAAVEFALVMIPLFVIVLGLIQYGWYFYVAQNSSSAVGTVARKLEVGDCWTGTAAQTFAQAQAPQISALSVSPGAMPTIGTNFTVTVTANATIIGFLPEPNGGTVTKTVTARLEDDKPSSC
ncbi:MAG TPA: TadE/TadG family type IV pilus assembly protein [Nocardioides sp.]|jgi:Flp pilus assembly protein TadG|nr:TadE/TadG family type IV pilus assembly protein [Nocardioides sp.]